MDRSIPGATSAVISRLSPIIEASSTGSPPPVRSLSADAYVGPASSLRSRVRAIEKQAPGYLTTFGAQDLATLNLSMANDFGSRFGTSKNRFLRDQSGRLFIFKVKPHEEVLAESVSSAVRRLGGRFSSSVVPYQMSLGGPFPEKGMLRPLVKSEGVLSADPVAWSPLQREAIMLDQPWNWLLQNPDTHVAQYALFGKEQLPINIDCDRSFSEPNDLPVTRFTQKVFLPTTASSLVYDAYVHGRLDLDFSGLEAEVQAIANIDDGKLAAELRRYAEARWQNEGDRQLFVIKGLERKERIGEEFQTFISELELERAHNLGEPSAKMGLALRVGRRLREGKDRTLPRLTLGRLGDAARTIRRAF
jgi:hypothetical protein